ncbi:MAG: tetratricopeptide repeat protein [Phycisphaerales bacterium]|nr:tetratricopeptide repeat protein [Phycisphaerales bacterium]
MTQLRKRIEPMWTERLTSGGGSSTVIAQRFIRKASAAAVSVPPYHVHPMSTPERIAQFEKMASADPTNEMAHFSLGNAYLQAERFAEAAAGFERCIQLNPQMSKAYQLAGQAMIGSGWVDKAVVVLEQGWRIANTRGDLMPKTAMEGLLTSLGRAPPVATAAEVAEAESVRTLGTFICRRSGRAGSQLPSAPFRGSVGVWIHDNICEETWKQWIGQGTKVINELRLDFSRERDQEIYDQHMREYLGLDAETFQKITKS